MGEWWDRIAGTVSDAWTWTQGAINDPDLSSSQRIALHVVFYAALALLAWLGVAGLAIGVGSLARGLYEFARDDLLLAIAVAVPVGLVALLPAAIVFPDFSTAALVAVAIGVAVGLYVAGDA